MGLQMSEFHDLTTASSAVNEETLKKTMGKGRWYTKIVSR